MDVGLLHRSLLRTAELEEQVKAHGEHSAKIAADARAHAERVVALEAVVQAREEHSAVLGEEIAHMERTITELQDELTAELKEQAIAHEEHSAELAAEARAHAERVGALEEEMQARSVAFGEDFDDLDRRRALLEEMVRRLTAYGATGVPAPVQAAGSQEDRELAITRWAYGKALEHRDEGNKLVQAQQYEHAIELYARAVDLLSVYDDAVRELLAAVRPNLTL